MSASVVRPRATPRVRRGPLAIALLGVLCIPWGAPAVAFAQGAAQRGGAPPAERTVEGRIVRMLPGTRSPQPIAGVVVTLHRIGTDSAGPVDSLVTRADGRYAFRWRPSGDDATIHLVSAEHGGIAYFGQPLDPAGASAEETELVVFDTTSAPVPISVNARRVIVGAPFEGERRVLEVYELSNDTLLTAVPGSRERAVWTAIVPESAHDLEVPGDQGVASRAVELRDGRILLFAPFTPGVRQLAFAYHVPFDAFPVSLPLERDTRTLEVMFEEAAATASAPGLTESDPVAVEGRTFRRFVARDLPASGVLALRPPAPPPSSRALPIAVTITAIGVVMLLVLARTLSRGGALRRRAPTAAAPSSERVGRQIQALDAAFARLPTPTDEARDAYRAQRSELVAMHEAALAREGRRR